MDDLSRKDLLTLTKQLQTQLDERDATIRAQQETIDQLQELVQSLGREMALLKRSLFGRRRERFDDPNQGTLFDAQWIEEAEQDAAGDEEADNEQGAEAEEADDAGPRKRAKRGRIVFPSTLPRKEVVHPLTDDELPEPLRGRDDVRRFRKKVREYLELEPASAYVVEEYVEVLAADNADATETKMLAASRPPRILDCYAGPSLLASLAVEHFADYLPYYRAEERLGRLGVKIPRSTIARWMIRLADGLQPLIDPMRQAALASAVACVDETSVKLLDPDLPCAKNAYLWAVVGDAAHPYTTFYFTEDRSRAGPEKFLRSFDGVLVSDAYVCYESLQREWSAGQRWACCHAHARRKFEELHYLGATEQTATALGYFRRLFEIENGARTTTDEERHAVRQEHSRPILTAFKDWMDGQLEVLRPKHPLRGAIGYMTNRWPSFARFLESGAIPLDNNAAEQAVKLPVIGKKNHLFFASPQGGAAAMVFYSLTATCRRLHIDPLAYLRDVFARLPQLDGEDVASLLPDRWLAAHPQHRLEHRAKEASSRAKRKRTNRAQRRQALARAARQR
jgi:transposase